MKKIFILQNSQVSFGLDASKLYHPDRYLIYLISNSFCENIVKAKQQTKYYEKIFTPPHFEAQLITSIIESQLGKNDAFDILTNSEETMPICGKLRVHFGLDTEDYSRFYDKHVMKQRLLGIEGVYIPKYVLFDTSQHLTNPEKYLRELLENYHYPLFAKPTNLYSSMSLMKINNEQELKLWAETAGDETFEIDEFISGEMYHCDSYIKEGKILFTLVSKNSRPCYDFTVGKMKGTIVLPRNHPDTILLSKLSEITLEKLSPPKAGVTHIEFIKTSDGKIYFIEIAHRSPGCLIPDMYLIHAGIDTISSHFLLQMDEDYRPSLQVKEYSAWACYPKRPGKLLGFKQPSAPIESAYTLNWNLAENSTIDSFSKHGRDYIGAILLRNSKFEPLYEEFMRINNDDLCIIQDL